MARYSSRSGFNCVPVNELLSALQQVNSTVAGAHVIRAQTGNLGVIAQDETGEWFSWGFVDTGDGSAHLFDTPWPL